MGASTTTASRVAAGMAAALTTALLLTGPALADPVPNQDSNPRYDRPQLLPIVTPEPSDWQPQFPLHYADLRRYVADADVAAERDMCQWFTAQYDPLRYQIEGLNDAVIRSDGDWESVGEQAGVVIANVDQSLDFLTPRAQALTQSLDQAGDMYFPLYQGDAFYGLWQQMANVGDGLRARQPTWFSGPSFLRMLHWGSKINRSHVCR